MARKSQTTRIRARRAPQSSSTGTASEGGPLTLAEAQRLARRNAPRRTMRRMSATAVAAPTIGDVGAERKNLVKANDADREQRIREYRATMELLKRRGARAEPAAARVRRRRALGAPAASFAPLQVVAEGDSWFDYPPFLLTGGIIPRLQRRLGVPILNLAKAGDEVRFMLGVKQRLRLIETLTDGCPAGGPWDAMLFSGGGNDVSDDPMALWIRDWDATIPPARHIIQPRFDAALALVRAGYEDLIALRDALSPDTALVFHSYDFAIPDGRGVCTLGPWLKPAFDLRRFPNRAAATAVVEEMLRQFAGMLAALARHRKVVFIDTQDTLPRQTSSWHNELHPERDGFDKFAELFHQRLKALFPDRVA